MFYDATAPFMGESDTLLAALFGPLSQRNGKLVSFLVRIPKLDHQVLIYCPESSPQPSIRSQQISGLRPTLDF